MVRANRRAQQPAPVEATEIEAEEVPGRREWRPVLRTWLGRLALVGLGVVIGAEFGRTWAQVTIGVAALLVVVTGTAAYLVYVERDLDQEPDPRQRAAAQASAMLRSAEGRAAEVRRAAQLEAAETLTAAQQEATLIVERARTAATALEAAQRDRPDRPQ